MTLSLPRLLASALLAIALLPAAAHADISQPALPVPAADALTSTAHGLAVARWGADPCSGQVAVTWAHMGAGINARSQWMSVDVHNPATYSQCSITYNLDVDWDWPKLCTVIEHELGHLAGHDHVNDPHDVMSPYYVYPTAECAAGQPTAAATPAPATVAQAPAVASPRKATSKRKVAKRKAVKGKASAKSTKTGSARPASSKKTKRGHRRAPARAAVADSRDHAASFVCTLVSA
jgi:hypothetical protein